METRCQHELTWDRPDAKKTTLPHYNHIYDSHILNNVISMQAITDSDSVSTVVTNIIKLLKSYHLPHKCNLVQFITHIKSAIFIWIVWLIVLWINIYESLMNKFYVLFLSGNQQ